MAASSGSSDRNDDLELMWSSFCTEARQCLPPAAENFPVGFLPDTADDDLVADGDSRRPPPLLGWEQPDTEAQANYISLLESFIDDDGQQPQQWLQMPLVERHVNHGQLAGITSEAQKLRRENKLLRAKNTMLERLLRESNNRCRRAEQINARWRTHLNALRKRERDESEQRQKTTEKASRSHAFEQQNANLRIQLKDLSTELMLANQRAVEAERTCSHLREALSQAMGSLAASASEPHR
jgi:DNA repair exonuclease SbcCD ATPase subunit